MQGPSQEVGSILSNEIKNKRAIAINSFQGLEVDNCELYGWPLAGIQIGGGSNSPDNKIHHNSLYNNRQKALGYGILVQNGFAVIKRHGEKGPVRPGKAACSSGCESRLGNR